MDTKLNHLQSLDGLRAIAIILVVLYHGTPNHNSDLGLRSIVFKIADVGWSGVDLFFMLSGFLITRILISYRTKGIKLSVFFKKRMLRIVPLYMLALTIVLVISPPLLGFAWPGWQTYMGHFFYYSNFIKADASYEHYYLLGHFWSLAVEMQFYLLFPILGFVANSFLS